MSAHPPLGNTWLAGESTPALQQAARRVRGWRMLLAHLRPQGVRSAVTLSLGALLLLAAGIALFTHHNLSYRIHDYAILNLAGQLRERKVANIERTRPAIVATGNIGCMAQIGKGLADRGSGVPVVHTVELLDWATGGPMPEALEEAGFGKAGSRKSTEQAH
jgi:hypothetical protein